MMMPANFSAVAENEMTYVVGGSLVDVLAPAMTTENWQNVSTNVIKIVGNAFIDNYAQKAFSTLFDGYYVPGDIVGGLVGSVANAYKKGASTLAGEWAMGLGVLNAGMSILGGLSAIYTLGSSPIGLETKGKGLTI
jgi:hypothetical protein